MGKSGTKIRDANSIGIKIPYPEDSNGRLTAFNGETIKFKLPTEIKLEELGWFSVWCVRFSVNFAHVNFGNKNVDIPEENENEIRVLIEEMNIVIDNDATKCQKDLTMCCKKQKTFKVFN